MKKQDTGLLVSLIQKECISCMVELTDGAV